MDCVIRCSNSGVRTNHVSEDSDEDEKLKQALVLVDLLKIEYAKALRDNHNLRQKGSTLTDDATCASTDEPTASRISAHSTNSQQPGSILVDERVHWQNMTGSPQPFQDSPKENSAFQPNKFFRRRIPADYYFDYPIRGLRRRVPFRRENEGDSITEAATDRLSETTTVPSLTNTDASDDASAARTDAVSTNIAPTATIDTVSVGTTAATTQTVTSTEPETKTEFELLDAPIDNTLADTTSGNSETENKEDDPVMSQVAEELIHELKAEKTYKTKRKPPTTRRLTKIISNSYLKLAKPTLKIHLGGSTRFSIPLPQNHAFCYTNPRNALCRTSI